MLNQSGSFEMSSSDSGSPMKPRSKSTEAFLSAGSIPSAPRNLSRSSSLRMNQKMKGRRSPVLHPNPVRNLISSVNTISSHSTPTHKTRLNGNWRPPIAAEVDTLGNFKRSNTLTGISKGQRRTDILPKSQTHELWSHPMECLKLTARELSHIRQVFSRAEIEKYHSDTALYKLLSKEKICLNCKIQKFNWMTWPYTCEVCKAKICKKCARSVWSPTEDPLDASACALRPISADHPDNAADDAFRKRHGGKRMTSCDPCVELLQHIAENARKAIEARSKLI